MKAGNAESPAIAFPSPVPKMELKSLVALAWMELSSVDVDANESKMIDRVNCELKATES
jgi:hypothetical protein